MNKNEQKGADAPVVNLPAQVNAVNDLPKGTIVTWGDTVINEAADQVAAIRSYIRSRVLKQFGVTGLNNQTVSSLPIGFGGENVQTSLKLPKVQTKVDGSYSETLEAYYKRVLPNIIVWFKNCVHNTNITVAMVETMN